MRYPLTGKKNTFTRGLKIHLARAGYFCLDKASFFIDDPINPTLEGFPPIRLRGLARPQLIDAPNIYRLPYYSFFR